MPVVTAATNVNEPITQQLSNGGGAATGTGGAILGTGPTDLIGFYGIAQGLVQPSGSGQAGVVTGASGPGNAAGSILHYNSPTLSASSVAANTAVEQIITITGVPLQSTDLVFVNKPTTNAGIGVGMGRSNNATTANTVALTFVNATAGTLTPTATQSYIVNTVSGTLALTQALTVAAIAASTVVEQQFNVTGLQPGMLVQVNKPSSNPGIAVLGSRVVANNVLGITFVNATTGVLTPTTNQTYTIAALNQLVAATNILEFGVLAAGAPSTVASQTSVEAMLTEAGLLATDIPMGVASGSLLPGTAILPGRILTAAQWLANYINPSAVVATPSATAVHNLSVYRQQPAAPMSLFSTTITSGSVAANTSAEQTFTVTGITSGQPVAITPATAVTAGGVTIAGIRASATNTVAINFYNATATAYTPAPFAATVVQFNYTTPSAGNNVSYLVTPLATVLTTLLANIRSAMVSLGLIKGS